MELRVGRERYHIIASDERLRVNGRPVRAVCDHDARHVIVGPEVDPQQLAEVIGEAVARIFVYRYGSAAGGSEAVETGAGATRSDRLGTVN